MKYLLLFTAFISFLAQAQEQILQNLSSPSSQSEDLDSLGKVPDILRWQSAPNAQKYVVEISRSPDFNKKTFEVDKNRLHVRVYPNVKYYWKVTALDSQNQAAASSANDPYFFTVLHAEKTQENQANETSEEVVADEEREPAATEELAVMTSPRVSEFSKQSRVWLSTEMGQVSMDQVSNNLGNMDLSGIMFPSLGLSYQSPYYWERVFFQVSFNQVKTDFSTETGSIQILNADFNWLQYQATLSYSLIDTKWFNRGWVVNLFAGAEYLKTPFFLGISATAVDVRGISYLNGVLGVSAQSAVKENWSYQTALSYSQPMSADGDGLQDVNVTSSLLLDWQLGAQYYISSTYHIGLLGKWSYRDFQEDLTSSTSGSSERKSTYIGAELNFGVQF